MIHLLTKIKTYFRKRRSLYFLKRVNFESPVKVVIGASGIVEKGWIPTEMETIDLLKFSSWRVFFHENSITNIFAEHVWEHLSLEQGILAAKNCCFFLKKGGVLRIAVPDGGNPDQKYIDEVRPGGNGYGADDHKVLYDYKSLSEVLFQAGFDHLELIEYWNSDGEFVSVNMDKSKGIVRRSSVYDKRNISNLVYTSLIIDAIKNE